MQEQEQECQKQDCCQTRQQLTRVKQEIDRLQSQPCRSKQCQNTQLSILNTRIGPPIPDDDDSSEIPISTMLKHLCEM